MALKLMYITNNPDVALIAQENGVDRIWVDMEYKGKDIRQKGLNSVKNHHTVEDIRKLRPYVSSSELLVRINPWDDASSVSEINKVIDAGADIIMLPMWKSENDVSKFLTTVGGRTKTSLLLENDKAVDCLDKVLDNGGFDEIHIGLNDLHLSYGKSFMFELMTDGTIERLCNKIKQSGIPFGFGGIAKLGEGAVPAEKVIIEHYRLGSTRAILSRSFCDSSHIDDINQIKTIFRDNMFAIRNYEKIVSKMTEIEYLQNQKMLQDAVSVVVKNMKSKRGWYVYDIR